MMTVSHLIDSEARRSPCTVFGHSTPLRFMLFESPKVPYPFPISAGSV